MSMFQSVSCLLCINICNGHRSLCDEDGRRNEVYALTEKYFAHLLLNLEFIDNFTVICMECWRHIIDFYSFQQSVVLAQQLSFGNSQTEANDVSKREESLDAAVFYRKPIKSIGADLQHHNENSSGVNDSHGPEDITRATATTSSQNRGNVDDTSQPPDVLVKSTVEGELTDIANDSCSDSDSDNGHQSTSIVKSEYMFNEVSRDHEDCDEESKEPDEQCQEIDDTSDSASASASCLSESEEFGGTFSADAKGDRQEKVEPVKQNVDSEFNGPKPKPKKQKRKVPYRQPLATVQEYDTFIANWRSNLECLLCSDSCSSFSLLQQHFEKQHPNEECHIICCQLKFYQRHEIIKHIHFHIGPQAFKCEPCYIGFRKKSSLDQHLQRIHSGKPKDDRLPIRRRKHISGTDHNLKPHQGSHTCDECGNVYLVVSTLNRHKRKVHSGSSVTLKCSICDKVYTNAVSLRSHMDSHADSPSFTCIFCPNKYVYRSTLEVHLNRKHHKEWTEKRKEIQLAKLNKIKEKKPHKCNICNSVLASRQSLRRHQEMHTV